MFWDTYRCLADGLLDLQNIKTSTRKLDQELIQPYLVWVLQHIRMLGDIFSETPVRQIEKQLLPVILMRYPKVSLQLKREFALTRIWNLLTALFKVSELK